MSTERAGMALVLQMPKELIALGDRLRFCEVVREKLRRTHNDCGYCHPGPAGGAEGGRPGTP